MKFEPGAPKPLPPPVVADSPKKLGKMKARKKRPMGRNDGR